MSDTRTEILMRCSGCYDGVEAAVDATARRCAEIAMIKHRYVSPEDDYWRGAKDAYLAMFKHIVREFLEDR